MLVKVTVTREVPIDIIGVASHPVFLKEVIEELASNASLDPMFDCREHLKSMNFREDEIEKIMQIFVPQPDETYIVEVV